MRVCVCVNARRSSLGSSARGPAGGYPSFLRGAGARAAPAGDGVGAGGAGSYDTSPYARFTRPATAAKPRATRSTHRGYASAGPPAPSPPVSPYFGTSGSPDATNGYASLQQRTNSFGRRR